MNNKNLLKDIIYGVIIVILLGIQSANSIAIAGVFPDFLLILVILHAIRFGDFKGMIFGFFMGLLVDGMSGVMFGLSAFVYTFLAWFTNFYKKYIQVSDVVAFLLYISVATVVKYIFFALFHWIFNNVGFFDGYFILNLMGEVVYNAVIGAIFFFATQPLYKREQSEF